MITRQRLGQLIKEEKFIYTTRFGGKKPEKFKLYKDFYMSQEDMLCCLNKSQEFLVCKVKFKYIFETKEDAEWQLEFGNIQRTETLSLPNWEEFENDNDIVAVYTKNHLIYHLYYYIDKLKGKIILIERVDAVNNDIIFNKPLTKENYIEACKLAKKLFLGE